MEGFAINRKAGKHLTPKFEGPLIVIRILTNGGVLCVSPKTKKEFVTIEKVSWEATN